MSLLLFYKLLSDFFMYLYLYETNRILKIISRREIIYGQRRWETYVEPNCNSDPELED